MIVAEGRPRRNPRRNPRRLQWGRNLIVAEGRKMITLLDRLESFNGAAT